MKISNNSKENDRKNTKFLCKTSMPWELRQILVNLRATTHP